MPRLLYFGTGCGVVLNRESALVDADALKREV
jgi:hypothetical protein